MAKNTPKTPQKPPQKYFSFNFKPYDAKHRKQLKQLAASVAKLYDNAIKQLSQKAANTSIGEANTASEFKWQDFPGLEKEANAIIKDLGEGLNLNLDKSVNDAVALANAKNTDFITSLAKRIAIPNAIMATWTQRNTEAVDAANKRIEKGMNLSDGSGGKKGVWNLSQFKTEMELHLQTCMGQGMSATEMASQFKQYLKYPDKLFRRVRDEYGVLRLSKAAKAFHPGAGVYRSSYKNALRLTATENNIAYRSTDHERWQRWQWIIGIHVILSNTHPCEDICDTLSGKDELDKRGKYPKDFKFVGWHPWCRCFAIPIMPSDEEFNKYMEKKRHGEDVSDYQFDGEIKETPQEFNEWCKDNAERIQRAAARGKLPYFIKDNTARVEKAIGGKLVEAKVQQREQQPAQKQEQVKNTAMEVAAERHAARTPEQIADIKARAAERQERLKAERDAKVLGNTEKQSEHLADIEKYKYNAGKRIEATMKLTGCTFEEAQSMNNAVREFSNGVDKDIRKYLNGERNFITTSGVKYEEIKELAENTEKYIHLAPKWNGGTTYRGMTMSSEGLGELIDQLKQGNVDMRGCASWTTKEAVAEKYSRKYMGENDYKGRQQSMRVILQSDTHQKATSIQHLSLYAEEEAEVLGSVIERWELDGISKKMKNGEEYTIIKVKPFKAN